jgi:hypothetical protein
MSTTYRQGDILFISQDAPFHNDAAATGSLEIAQGEVTGHAHVLYAEEIGFDTDWEKSVSRLSLALGGTLRHDEHAPIILPPGSYTVRRQREYAYGKPIPADD